MAVKPYISCTRMYNACAPVTELWSHLIRLVSDFSGIALRTELHSFPKDIEELWKRNTLGLVFICGRAFMLNGQIHKPIAVPLRTDAGYVDAPLYHTDLLVRSDSPWQRLEDTFGGKLGWTVSHSHSGYIAVREHLALYAPSGAQELYAEYVGPLHTPANCVTALLRGDADVAPLDAYYRRLLARNAPEMLAGTRVIASTIAYPMPFLVASPDVDDSVCHALRQVLLAAHGVPEFTDVLEKLCISGFAVPDITQYARLLDAPAQAK